MKTEIPIDVKEKIDYIMDNFNFERIEKIMRFDNWTWCKRIHKTGYHESDYVRYNPNKKDLMETVYGFLLETLSDVIENNKKESNMSSGGFSVVCVKDDNDICFFVSFILDSIESE